MAVNALLLELFDLFESSPVDYTPALTDASRTINLFLDELAERMAGPAVEGSPDCCANRSVLCGRAHSSRPTLLCISLW